MRKTLLFLSILAVLSGVEAVQAKEDQCKICRDYQAACVKAHTKEACQSELNICLKHCRAPK